MKKYTFGGPKGILTTVEANDEKEARHLAMVQRHGPLPDNKLGIHGRYKGLGLWIVFNAKES